MLIGRAGNVDRRSSGISSTGHDRLPGADPADRRHARHVPRSIGDRGLGTIHVGTILPAAERRPAGYPSSPTLRAGPRPGSPRWRSSCSSGSGSRACRTTAALYASATTRRQRSRAECPPRSVKDGAYAVVRHTTGDRGARDDRPDRVRRTRGRPATDADRDRRSRARRDEPGRRPRRRARRDRRRVRRLLQNTLTVAGVSDYYMTFTYGAVLVAGIIMNGLVARRPTGSRA